MEERRRELFTLFKNISKIAFPETLAFVVAGLQATLGKPTSTFQVNNKMRSCIVFCTRFCYLAISGTRLRTEHWRHCHAGDARRHAWGAPKMGMRRVITIGRRNICVPQEVEMVITLLYELGEGAPEEALKPETGGLAAAVVGFAGARLPSATHRLVGFKLCALVVLNISCICTGSGEILWRKAAGGDAPTGTHFFDLLLALGRPITCSVPRMSGGGFAICRPARLPAANAPMVTARLSSVLRFADNCTFGALCQPKLSSRKQVSCYVQVTLAAMECNLRYARMLQHITQSLRSNVKNTYCNAGRAGGDGVQRALRARAAAAPRPHPGRGGVLPGRPRHGAPRGRRCHARLLPVFKAGQGGLSEIEHSNNVH